MVNTKGIPRWKVLKALYDASKPMWVGVFQYTPEPLTHDQSEALLEVFEGHNFYFDYLQGRVMKVSLKNEDGFDEWGYDHDNGDGAAERAIAPLREASDARD